MSYNFGIPRKQTRVLNPVSFDFRHVFPALGIDEVGTGAAAGPIYMAGVCLPYVSNPSFIKRLEILKLRDSKKMTERQREAVSEALLQEPTAKIWIERVLPEEINSFGQHATIGMAFNRIIKNFKQFSQNEGTVIVDGNANSLVTYSCVWYPQGDNRSLSISAASVVAKVARDAHMTEMSEYFPEWEFDSHKGYLTEKHQNALTKHGACEMHHTNIAMVKKAVELNGQRR